jgi:hypothetical protein
MTDDSSDVASSAGAPAAPTLQIKPTTSVADVLAALKRQGISDLESLVRALVQKVEQETAEDDEPFEKEFLIHDHYVLTHTGDLQQ